MKISIVVTTYNGQRFISELLNSLYNQSRQAEEVLFYDDVSTDKTVEIIYDFIEKNRLKNWKVVVNEKNLGWEKNFTKALNCASGDIIFPCDQDDTWHNDKLEKMSNEFLINKKIQLLVSDYNAISLDGANIEKMPVVETVDENNTSKVKLNKYYNVILRPGCAMAINKKIMPLFNELWEEGMPHDLVLWNIANLLDGLYIIREKLIDFRRHSSNASKKLNHNVKSKQSNIIMVLKINNWILSSRFCSDYKKNIVNKVTEFYKLRYKLIINKKILCWFMLSRYIRYYYRKRQYLGDLYYFFKSI